MSLQPLRTQRRSDEGELVGLPFIDCAANIPIINGTGGADPHTADVVCTLPAAPAGLTQPEPALVVGALAPPAIVQGDCVVAVQAMTPAALAAGLVLGHARVTLAGGAAVGQITVRIANANAANSAAVPAGVLRFFLLR